MSLLAIIIIRIENETLGEVLEKRIFKPFSMTNSYLDVPEHENKNRVVGYIKALNRLIPMPNWNCSFPQGANGVVSNVIDLRSWSQGFLKFLNSHAEFKELLFHRKDGVNYDYGWELDGPGLIRHSGESPGFCSYIALNENGKIAAYTLNIDICLRNTSSIRKKVDELVKL